MGGTNLPLDASGNRTGAETAWSGSWGGLSAYESEPAYQSSYGISSNGKRAIPDMATDADPNTGVAVYDSISYQNQTGWFVVGGTSLASLLWADFIVMSDQIHNPGISDGYPALYNLATGCSSWLWSDVVESSQSKVDRASGGPTGGSALRTLWNDALIGLTWIRQQPVLLFMLAVAVATNLIVFPFYSLLPAFLAEMQLVDSALVYGRAASAYGGGMLLTTALVVPLTRKIHQPERVVGVTVLLICTVLGVMSWSRNPWLLILCSALVGVLFMVLVAVSGGTWLERTPSAVRVRVFSLRRLVSFASIPIGSTLMGLGGSALGFVPFLRILLAVAAGTVVLAWVLLRMLRTKVGADQTRDQQEVVAH